MIILDTNVLSELLRPRPDARVREWFAARREDELYTTAITVQESFYGAELLPESVRRSALLARLERLYADILSARVLPFDGVSARYTAVVLAHSRAKSAAMHQADAQIAGIALQHGATLATRNTSDFITTPVSLCNPWDSPAAGITPPGY